MSGMTTVCAPALEVLLMTKLLKTVLGFVGFCLLGSMLAGILMMGIAALFTPPGIALCLLIFTAWLLANWK